MTPGEIINDLNEFRDQIGLIDSDIVKLPGQLLRELPNAAGVEATENAKLAHRHLEDARMRLGKCIQALEGGQSILDHPEVKTLIAKIRAEHG